MAGKKKAPAKKPAQKAAKATTKTKGAKPAKTKTKAAATVAASPASPSGAGGMPVLYVTPRPLSVERHGGKSVRRTSNFDFARGINAVPLNGAQFALAMRDYPIVFVGEKAAMPLAVLGLRDGENLFVDAKGNWAEGTYIPAYVRRYPFIFLTGPDKEKFVLGVDEASDLVTDGDEQPLFDQGKPSELTKKAMEFCTAYQAQSELTRLFGAALAASGVMQTSRANVRLRSGKTLALGGFQIVDEKKFNALPDKTFLQWRKNGWLQLVYSHLMSLRNWDALIARAE